MKSIHCYKCNRFIGEVDYDEEKGSQIKIPKTILEKMGKPEKIKFVIEGKKIEVKPS
jgi:hypothetical protein